MKNNALLLLLFCLLLMAYACEQNNSTPNNTITPTSIIELTEALPEVSGLEFHNSAIYAHNDGGNSPELFRLNSSTGGVEKISTMAQADNEDWEDIAFNDTHGFIGDFGNNEGNRMDLTVYRFALSDINEDNILTEKIAYSLADQTAFDFVDDHNFDCEAMVATDDALFLFSKNRVDKRTKCYLLPLESENPPAEVVARFDVDGLITGADISADGNLLVLLGFDSGNSLQPFIWLFQEYSGTDFFEGKSVKINIDKIGQTEGITFKDASTLLVSVENGNNTASEIWQFDIGKWLE